MANVHVGAIIFFATVFLSCGEVIRLNSHTLSSSIAHGTTLVLFHTPWCSSCSQVLRTLKELDIPRELAVIAEYDAENGMMLAQQLNVRSFPTILLFRKDGEKFKFSGKRTRAELLKFISRYTDNTSG